jgi:hypothetical protein
MLGDVANDGDGVDGSQAMARRSNIHLSSLSSLS